MNTWLLLDMHGLAYRAVHSTGMLKHGDIKTGIVYGILREIIQLQEQFGTDKIVFAFDHGKPLRKQAYPGYKLHRHKTDDQLQARIEVRKQLKAMRNGYLNDIGFRNLFWQNGYEADDVIARLCFDYEDRNFIIVSSDKDLYQLLGFDTVRMYNPRTKEVWSFNSFQEKYGIEPLQWVDVKAIAGCPTDKIKGIDGVGEKTAIKHLLRELTPKNKAWGMIHEYKWIWKRNLDLVRLPYKGIKEFKLVKDEVTPQKWRKVLESLGMSSLVRMIPGATKKTSFTRAEFKRR